MSCSGSSPGACGAPCAAMHVAALALAVLVVLFQLQLHAPKTLDADSEEYLGPAYILAQTGIYTDGPGGGHGVVHGANGEGMFFAPGYPAFLATLAKLSPAFHESARCVIEDGGREKCGPFSALILAQSLLAAFSAYLVWLSGLMVTGRKRIAWLAMGFSMAAQAYAYYAGIMLTELLVFPLFTGACLAAVQGWRRQSLPAWGLCGALLGALALTRPGFSYLAYAGVPSLALVCALFGRRLLGGADMRRLAAMPLLLLAGYAVIAGPWMVRNAAKIGPFAISAGYAEFTLAQRVAFNRMTWPEWRASFIYGLPDFGDSLARKLYPPERYERLDYANPEGFYREGVGPFMQEETERAGGREHLLGYLLRHEVFGNLGKHVAVTFSLLWRGIWVSKYWGLLALPLFAAVFARALRRGEAAFVLFSLPPWFMAGFHAFASVNVVRYNLILIPCLAIGAALALVLLCERLAGLFPAARPQESSDPKP